MPRPPLEVADIVRAHRKAFVERYQAVLSTEHLKVLRALENCRTSALGGHVDQCDRCGHQVISYNSCRNRHCPKCQTAAREKWLADRTRELLPVAYFHIVFTLPPVLAQLALQNQRALYNLLFRASSQTLMEIAGEPKYLGVEIGFLSVLHTWGQNLHHHPHVHCIVPAGGISPDHTRWIGSGSRFFLPVRVLSRLFRGKFLALLRRAFQRGQLTFHGGLAELAEPRAFQNMVRQAYRQGWVVYAKRPFGSPQHLLQYLARYTHRVAISNHRLIAMADGKVTFRWRDYAHGNKSRVMTLDAVEFLRRFMLHVLPRGLVRVRVFGFLANRHRAGRLELCRRLLGTAEPPVRSEAGMPASTTYRCPHCQQGRMVVMGRVAAGELFLRLAERNAFDSS